MSINVTVTGNPVSVKRGRMVTQACDTNRQDFDKRRILRLEQVRQQSKEIAESVRNKVRKEKTGRLAEVEKEGEVLIQNWQARKLLELQNQYQEAINDIGLGHKQAVDVEKEEAVLAEKRKLDDQVARDRGREAAEKLQVEKNQANLKSALPIQHKKLSRDVENTRSAVVRKKNGKSPSKKAKRDGKVESANIVPQLVELDELDSSDFSDSEVLRPSLKSPKATKTRRSVEKVSKEAQTSLPPEKIEKEAQTHPDSILCSPMLPGEASDNRISERIKRRSLLNPDRPLQEVSEREIPLTHQTTTVPCNCCKCHEVTKPVAAVDAGLQKDTYRTEEVTDSRLAPEKEVEKTEEPKKVQKSSSPKKSSSPVRSKMQKPTIPPRAPVSKSKPKPVEIPTKPRVTLKATKPAPRVPSSAANSKVQYYDHPNRFTKYGPSTSRIDRIDEESLIISPNPPTEEDLKEEMRKRDLEAHNRGLQAMEKEKISREYDDLLKKLPLLQKQERIFDINGDKPRYHMPDNRLEEFERRRQNQMDNTYEKLFSQRKPATVTLPRKVNGEGPGWDVDFRDVPRGRPDHQKNRSQQLNELLEGLRSQKENLLKEIEGLPDGASVASLLEDLTSTSIHTKKGKRDKKRKRDARVPSPTESDSYDFIGPESRSTLSNLKDTATGSYPSPRKKPKKTVTKVLQNMSTQTTPKPQDGTKLSLGSTKTCGTCLKGEEPCFCDQSGDLCEILIKIKEGDQPEVIVNPPNMGQNVRILTERPQEKEKSSTKDSSKSSSSEITRSPPRKITRSPPRKAAKSPTKKKKPVIPVRDRASWREQLSHVSSLSTTTTSYFSPPEFFKSSSSESSTQIPRVPPRMLQKPKSLGEFSNSSDGNILDPRLLIYIKKLLDMSHATIDDLSISDASGVSTPSQSVIEMPTNNPRSQLKNVMRYFNLDPAVVKQQLSQVSSDSTSTPHFNTSESTTSGASKIDVGNDFDPQTKQKLAQYAELADNCNRKISSLTAMIEKVREEKEKMLQSPPGSNNNSTAYLELPQAKLTSSSSKTDESKSAEVSDEIDKDLLDVDLSYAEKLKNLTPVELEQEKSRQDVSLATGTDDELLKRLKQLLGDDKATQVEKAPMLNIPKLPKFNKCQCPPVNDKNKRPPPVKSVRIVQKLNGDYSVPHELSTIMEADSQVSTRAEPTPKKSSSCKSSPEGSVPDLLSEVPQMETEVKNKSSDNSSDDKSDLEAMESMLHSIGMEWAIPTLRKTREALALSSSSSEGGRSSKSLGDVSLRQFLTKNLIASSSLKSDGSPLGFSGEIQDISVIQYEQRRTSTPVQQSSAGIIKRPGEGLMNAEMLRKVGFSGESDLSSVKVHSCECSSSKSGSDLQFYDLNEESVTVSKTLD